MFRAVLPYYLLDLLLWSQQLDSLTEAHACRACYGWATRASSGAIPVKSDLRQTKADSQVIANLRRGRAWRPMATAGS